MKRQRKHFCGILGLFLVTAMTTYAYSLPTQNTNATDVRLNVTVINNTTSLTVKSIKPDADPTIIEDGQTIDSNKISVLVKPIANTENKIYLINNADENENLIATIIPETDTLEEEVFEINLDDYGGEGDYKVIVRTADLATTNVYEKFINFTYELPIEVPDTGIFSRGLNLAQADYLIAGAIAIVTITAGALLFRKKDSQK